MSAKMCGFVSSLSVLLGLVLITMPSRGSGAGDRVKSDDKDQKKEQGLPLKPTRKVSFTTDEGTWMSLDVSPDGKQIVFDLLGDLYTLPISGGEATRITSGMAWDCQPRFSPDGRQIAFISDRDGSDNLWLVNTDGSRAKQVTHDTDYSVGSPAWAPGGDYLVVRRWGPYPKPETYIWTTSLWMYHKDGGSGLEIKKGGQMMYSAAAFSPNGKQLYFSVGRPNYAKDADLGGYQVTVLNRETGEENSMTSEYGSGLRPIVSPDGRYLVYATRHDAKTVLKIHDLQTQEDHWLAQGMQRDDQEGSFADDVVPGYAFTPDSKAVIFPGDGHIQRVDIATRQVKTIPFTAKVEQDLAPRVRVDYKIDDGPMTVRQMRWMNSAPDGKLVFEGVGKVWLADSTGGNPHRLTNSTLREYQPIFSPDGRWIAYVSWSDTEGGQIWKAPADGGSPVQLTRAAGFYMHPSWSPDGSKLVFEASNWETNVQGESTGPAQLRWISADGGDTHLVATSSGSHPRFNMDGTRIYFMTADIAPAAGGGFPRATSVFCSVRLDGLDRRTHLRIITDSFGTDVVPSPDEKWVIVYNRYDTYVAPFAKADVNTPVSIVLAGGAVPVKRLTKIGGNYPHWMDGGKTITWSFANEFSRASFADIWNAEKDDTWKAQTTTIQLQVPRGVPRGTAVLRNARLITMKGQEIIERGDILIQNNRIKEVGAAGSIHAPADAKVIDLRGKTVMPGFVDIHAHMGTGGEIVPERYWSYAANLAYGVTTTRDPSSENNYIFASGELVEAGDLIGPRIYSTGTAMTTDAVTMDSYEDVENIIKRYKRTGADSLKQYMQPRRIQRQWAMAAAKEGINLTAEGALDLKLDLTMVLDGYTGVEHSLPVNPVYKDVMELEAQSRTTYTPTLVVSYGAPEGEYYWRQRMNIHDDPKVMRFTPHEEIDSKARRVPMLFDQEYDFKAIAAGAAGIVSRGGHAALGSHGEQQGIGAQWELWMLQSGGMTPWQALWCATMNGAESIGLEKEIGSIEPGKLADLLVLNANPLENIQNTNKIQYVIKNGVVYNGDTLDEVWPSEKKFPPFIWKKSEAELQRESAK
jgi:Tol biopolymer transport system component/imidazolonepropionase-like amidohydrolase